MTGKKKMAMINLDHLSSATSVTTRGKSELIAHSWNANHSGLLQMNIE